VDAKELRNALNSEAGLNVLLALKLDGKSYLTLARELQRHPVRGTLTHVDFQVVDRDIEIAADVSVILIGEPTPLNRADGILEQHVFTLTVKAKPADIPTTLEVDISELGIGDVIRVADVPLPAGVTAEADGETVVASGIPPRVQAAAGEGEGAAEGEGASEGS
jgi:large subunit ribosomal protein L25